ncbi:peptide-methionine (S)-S-oxide reductase MsrA [Maritalea mediterranea]|uniref:Peptide methionine sulfoxide reductase MsrA n=1 Tax=Maritalea mediterranea TaxID=2909667 RepID=A0ABS9E7L4_9HYPH|nr:peptide-methionine (S)-S-oxide reductase MsrA [Maritalea mediterranea]MCF4098873.1 peptide-methionine (S)-S-oxide reductase MsrA [Maritalea mediterranea]
MRALIYIVMAALLSVSTVQAAEEKAVFAGGCFWCVEADFEKVDGVKEAISGYIGGTVDNPTYEQVTGGNTGHYEAVEIIFDNDKVSYRELVDILWRTIDPVDAGGQFCDRGNSYRTAVFTRTADQEAAALASKAEAEEALGQRIVTPIIEDDRFYKAEDYHQDYYKKNPVRYNFYRFTCGRDKRVEALWGDQAYRGIEK